MAMTRAATGIGVAIALTALSGCVPPPPPPAVVVAAPPPIIAAAPMVLIPEPPPPVPVIHHHRAAVAHGPVHHHVHRYVSRTRVVVYRSPYCGSPALPCNVEHITVPIQ
jgi:hypothetical protein